MKFQKFRDQKHLSQYLYHGMFYHLLGAWSLTQAPGGNCSQRIFRQITLLLYSSRQYTVSHDLSDSLSYLQALNILKEYARSCNYSQQPHPFTTLFHTFDLLMDSCCLMHFISMEHDLRSHLHEPCSSDSLLTLPTLNTVYLQSDQNKHP